MTLCTPYRIADLFSSASISTLWQYIVDEGDWLDDEHASWSDCRSLGASNFSLILDASLPSRQLYQPPVAQHILGHSFDLILARSLPQ
jgi:hypothetical protein